MKYLITDEDGRPFDYEYQPITLEAALEAVRRVAAYVEAIGNEPKATDADAKIRVGPEAGSREPAAAAA